MEGLISILLVISCLIGWIAYRKLFKLRYLFSDRFGFSSTITVTNILTLTITCQLSYLFSNEPASAIVVNIIIGIIIGISFGALINYQTLMAGVYSGVTGGLMGSMIGAVAKDPSICALPSDLLTEQEMILFFSTFGNLLLAATTIILFYSFRV
ncbi:hypothetical protein [Litchfieldia alkalitelluris]|uniref:hypothetical protein n=1 Tax=Litchfieldia alkalitelluris TaxID=304268 RepID=UPI000996CDF7|nr:hypothetical protein [Litchfieldia alkalitelluris]